jgi:branched-chain amino acid transport system substrate-binding protein
MSEHKRVFFIGFALLFGIILVMPPFAMAQVETIKIGIYGPLKFLVGIDAQRGAMLAAEEINEAGGINIKGKKHKVELFIADSNELISVPDALNAVERLIKLNNVRFVIGGYRSEAALAMMDMMFKNKVIFMTTACSHTEFADRVAKDYEKYKYWFRVGVPSVRGIGTVVLGILEESMQKVRKDMNIQKPRVAIIAEKALFADALTGLATGTIPKLGGEVIGSWRPSPHATDVSTELTAIKEAGAHVIFTALAGPVGVTVSRQWSQLQIPTALIGLNNEAIDPKYWEKTGGMCNYEATYNMLTGTTRITEKTIPFYNKFSSKFGIPPIGAASGNSDAVHLVKKAIEETGSLDPDKLIEKLETMEFVGNHSPKVAFYPKGHKWAHDLIYGPKYTTLVGIQWQNEKCLAVWPTGRPVLGDKTWEGLRYDGTVDYVLPPQMIKYWKGK